MASTRIALVGLPRMLQDIVAGAVRAEPDMVVEWEGEGEAAELSRAVERRPIDVLILGRSDRGLIEACRAVMTERPLTKVFEVREGGAELTLYELRSVVEPLGSLAPADLVTAIRTACARGLGWETA